MKNWLMAGLFALGVAQAGVAHARVDIGVTIGPPAPMYYEPSPVYVVPGPVYRPPVYVAPPVYRPAPYYAPPPVIYAPPPVYYGPRYVPSRQWDRPPHGQRHWHGRGGPGRWDGPGRGPGRGHDVHRGHGR